MNEELDKKITEETNQEVLEPQRGPISELLCKEGLEHTVNEVDHIGIEIISVKPEFLLDIIVSLKNNGFNYLECQGGYDEGPGLNIVCFYHLIAIENYKDSDKPREVRVKVFLNRDGDLKVPSLYKIFRGSDWQERETYDMFGVNFVDHPHPKRLLMPEDWKGWPLRKDYIQPDFYEMQDAY
ncbi:MULTISPECIES: NAD(P)H-quinone oxidoreductase subunit J [Prochlorococcus]|uniref:NAD(P)H-quinone oxidoreductase subunit J n=1 Tax=Prochlorococcus marinus (strain SARG / CCMP1375 / SS120) TaxID=167539 RepID=Q7VDP5_PROMA|nr:MULTISPECIES: NAD(P)H-quinone oxidoreductase subunit J [Prochlorococcus]AAP99369.1 NAD(P)H-quinone oxidoreductase subunit J [Prochlorococcus marinus subsp. marinus str. CCMP1375]KGG11360.1 NAD(P)H-quinone oxidoreductase chain J [Prochlorococcus marinus str. LG]KGG18685.1 NAD(P)H-quinone oxidoreductase chain J [Prochlorococcus marinus str. SS2]KGG22958.1 NAD(P)H-quinone oxidoreductase chain J [Prochlorococcus marinus str. SS35]KGG34062.1 NAD(P)H-quinone oxidoreductase chain J [Prochlorococcu